MNRLGTALLAAIEAVVTVGVGIGIALVPLTLLWGFEYGLQVDWDVFWKATGSVWLIGHGVDVSFLLGPALAKSTGVGGASAPIQVTLPALGFAIVTAWLAGRAGRRFAETDHRTTGLLVGTGVVALLGLGVALSTRSDAVDPTTWQAVVLPAVWFAVPALVTSEVCRRRRGLPADPATQRVIDLVDRIPATWRAIAAFGLRAGTVATAAVVAVAGIVVGFLLFTSFAEVIALYERSHAGIVGGIALTVGQLAFLPDFVGWATAWLVGPGFAIGTGSNVSPVATVLGPIPGFPVFGALPAAGHAFGLVWILVPVVAGFAAGGLLRPRLVRALGRADSALHRALGGVATGLVAGVLVGLVAWLSSGSFGPGRLADVGPHALVVGGFAALEVGVPAIVALAVGSDLVRLPERRWTREQWHGDPETAAVEPERAGSLIAALDRAGAGRTTDVHRFVVEDAHGGATEPSADADVHADPHADTDVVSSDSESDTHRDTARETDTGVEPLPVERPVERRPVERRTAERRTVEPDRASRPAGDDSATDLRSAPAPVTEPPAETDAGVALPDWARTDAVAAERLDVRSSGGGSTRGGVAAIRDRLRGAADGVRERAGALRERVARPDAADETDVRRPEPRAPGTEPQPAFPWSTEEFAAGRHDTDDETAASPAQPRPAQSGAGPRPGASGGPAPTGRPRWDATDQIPEDELPWWRKPKSAE